MDRRLKMMVDAFSAEQYEVDKLLRRVNFDVVSPGNLYGHDATYYGLSFGNQGWIVVKTSREAFTKLAKNVLNYRKGITVDFSNTPQSELLLAMDLGEYGIGKYSKLKSFCQVNMVDTEALRRQATELLDLANGIESMVKFFNS